MNTPTSPIEELRIILEGMEYLSSAEADTDHPDPTGDALEMIPEALAALRSLEKELE
jgi:hypothetical protein